MTDGYISLLSCVFTQVNGIFLPFACCCPFRNGREFFITGITVCRNSNTKMFSGPTCVLSFCIERDFSVKSHLWGNQIVVRFKSTNIVNVTL